MKRGIKIEKPQARPPINSPKLGKKLKTEGTKHEQKIMAPTIGAEKETDKSTAKAQDIKNSTWRILCWVF